MKANEIIKMLIIDTMSTMSKKDKVALIDAIAASAKLSKADAGRIAKGFTDQELINIFFGTSKTKVIDAIASGAKLTKADAGRIVIVIIELLNIRLKYAISENA
ncbi:MAG: hypothetical protein IPM51_10540 [Sphingobacteriaceae bacterium]|nr:hypothetical protein [Sphingobacteriaceae bacterium]